MKNIEKNGINIILVLDYIMYWNHHLFNYKDKISIASRMSDYIKDGSFFSDGSLEDSHTLMMMYQEWINEIIKIVKRIIKIKSVPKEVELVFNNEPKDCTFKLRNIETYSYNLTAGVLCVNFNCFSYTDLGKYYNSAWRNLSLIEILEYLYKKGEIILLKMESLFYVDKIAFLSNEDKLELKILVELLDEYDCSRFLFINNYLFCWAQYEIANVEFKFEKEYESIDSKKVQKIIDKFDDYNSGFFTMHDYFDMIFRVLCVEDVIDKIKYTYQDYLTLRSCRHIYDFYVDKLEDILKWFKEMEVKLPLEIQELINEIIFNKLEFKEREVFYNYFKNAEIKLLEFKGYMSRYSTVEFIEWFDKASEFHILKKNQIYNYLEFTINVLIKVKYIQYYFLYWIDDYCRKKSIE